MIDTSRSMIYHIGILNDESQRISTSLATGKAIDKGSDDAMLHGRIINLEDKLRVSESLKLQIEKTRALNDTADENIALTKEALESIKIDLMKALNDGMDRSDKLALATNLKGIRENIFDLVNAEVDGEYLFTGSVTTEQTLVKDADFDLNGQVEFGGDGFLRKIATQPGSYRDRGVTAYDVSFYTSSDAVPGETFTFSAGERIIDENGNEWKVMTDNGVEYDKDTMPITEAKYLQQFDDNGVLIDSSVYPEAKINIASTTAEAEATTNSVAVQETYSISVVAGTAAGQQPDSRIFEAKHSYFDDLNIAINALEGHITNLDGTKGAEISDAKVDEIIKDQLQNTTTQYDATNVGHGELGGRNNVFEVAYERLESQVTHYNILLQETSGADTSKLAMESASLELTYQALYSTISKMNEMSLVNFIK